MQAFFQSSNPQEFLRKMIESNPKLQPLVQSMSNSNLSPKEFFYQFAQNKNIDPDQFIQNLTQNK